jgi:hypothetical protein
LSTQKSWHTTKPYKQTPPKEPKHEMLQIWFQRGTPTLDCFTHARVHNTNSTTAIVVRHSVFTFQVSVINNHKPLFFLDYICWMLLLIQIQPQLFLFMIRSWNFFMLCDSLFCYCWNNNNISFLFRNRNQKRLNMFLF